MNDAQRPSVYDYGADKETWSDTAIGDKRLTWRELVDHLRERLSKVDRFATVLFDLDRCQHGRHAGDACGGCGGRSEGNPLAPVGSVIGYGLGGEPIVQPETSRRYDPDAWYARD